MLNNSLPIGANTPGNPPLSISTRGGLDYMRKISCKYHRIRELYNRYKENVSGELIRLLGCGKQEQWLQVRSDIENFTDSWHALVLKCVSIISSRSHYANVLIASSSLIPAYAKLLLYGMASFFPLENVYSSVKIGKEASLQRILSRYGKKCTYVIVGDGRDDEIVAKQAKTFLQFPLWRVTVHSDLVALHHALELGHL
ncbi:unnamed protein product [Soboliphyme baturini]|uniref:Eyes absent homolog n=1 Tax=Soboliphyme baturini TaxID=241478 RepID=A0A183INK3_9BILA|nr:unnamed protein product [Soboliphyme baturini]